MRQLQHHVNDREGHPCRSPYKGRTDEFVRKLSVCVAVLGAAWSVLAVERVPLEEGWRFCRPLAGGEHDFMYDRMSDWLDGRPLAESGRILVVHLTDMQGEGNVYADATRQILLKWGKGCLVEKGTAKVALVHPGDLRAWALDTTGRRVKELPVRRKGEWLLFDCSTADGTIYYEMSNGINEQKGR